MIFLRNARGSHVAEESMALEDFEAGHACSRGGLRESNPYGPIVPSRGGLRVMSYN